MMKYIIGVAVSAVLTLQATAQQQTKSATPEFDFVLMSDIHLKPDVSARFTEVIDTVNKMKADFVVAAGDLVFDVMRGNVAHADSLFSLYKSMSERFNKPVYNCVGNHDVFGIYPESDTDSTHPGYKYGMYKKYLGKTFYSMDHKGWHFVFLNSIDVTADKKYYGVVGKEQLDWLKNDLEKLNAGTPVALVTHIPLLSVHAQSKGNTPQDPNGILISNRKEVLELLDQYNVRLVMQGHIHWIEDIFINNKTHFLTAGSVAGRPSWRGTANGERGFMKISVRGEEISWKYIQYE